MIIDTHTHIFSEKAYNEYLDKAKGRVSKVLAISFALDPGKDRGIKNYKLENLLAFAATKENLYVVAAINITKDIPKQLTKIKKLFQQKKVAGIKLVPGYQHFYPSDKKIYPIAKLCEKYNKPLIFHSGDVYDPENRALLKYSHPIHIDELAIKFPECQIIIAHLGFPYLAETATVVSKNKNVYTDISGTIFESASKAEAKQLVREYIKDLKRIFAYYPDIKSKVMFGTDFEGEKSPLNQVGPYIETVKKVFSKNERKQVFYGLADKLFFS
ncbi:MAG: amidohydrolase family protein [Parcubacteria group bacterium]|jgi:hypothetical protein